MTREELIQSPEYWREKYENECWREGTQPNKVVFSKAGTQPKLKWIKATYLLPKEGEEVLMSISGDITTASYCFGKFLVTDDLEYTPEGRCSWDIDCEEPLVEIKWISLAAIMKFIEN